MIGLGFSSEKKNPAQFSFSSTTGVSASTLITTSIVPAGYDGAVTAVASGAGSPQVRKNSSGSFGSSVVLFPGDTLNVQLTSSSSYNTAVVATVTIGTISANWSVTTAAVAPGSQSFTTPGTFNFIPPVFNTMTVTVKGAGEGGGPTGIWTLSGGKSGFCIFHPGVAGANGAQSSFGPSPSLVGPGGKDTGAGTGTGGNNTNDTNGAAGGAGGTSTDDADCGPTGAGANGNAGGRAISVFSVGGLTVGANYTVVVGLGGAAGSGTATAGTNGSVTITWS